MTTWTRRFKILERREFIQGLAVAGTVLLLALSLAVGGCSPSQAQVATTVQEVTTSIMELLPEAVQAPDATPAKITAWGQHATLALTDANTCLTQYGQLNMDVALADAEAIVAFGLKEIPLIIAIFGEKDPVKRAALLEQRRTVFEAVKAVHTHPAK